MPSLQTIDLSHAADPRGTCPSCRHGRLTTTTIAVYPAAGGPHAIDAPAVECRVCGYQQRVERGVYVAGVGIVR